MFSVWTGGSSIVRGSHEVIFITLVPTPARVNCPCLLRCEPFRRACTFLCCVHLILGRKQRENNDITWIDVPGSTRDKVTVHRVIQDENSWRACY